MRKKLLTSAALVGMAFSLPALAQNATGPWAHEPGTGQSGPASAAASNIEPGDARSAIAPHLPEPMQGQAAGPNAYLHDAERAISRHQTGLAQQALEMAETRLLDRSTLATNAGMPDQNPRVQEIRQALNALGRRDMAGAASAVRMAMVPGPDQAGNGMAGPAAYNPGMTPPPNGAYAPPPTGPIAQ